jgi:acetoin utilization deacetylase AcuC-like enzyme
MKDHLKSGTTGYVFDPLFLKHTLADHPENDERLRAILAELEDSGLIQTLRQTETHMAKEDELSCVHQAGYIDQVKKQCRQSRYLDPDTYTNPFTYEAASRAAGSLIDLTVEVIYGTLRNGFALLRPPGHHALPDRAMGFCVFNNEAIAVRVAQKTGKLTRVAIVDFDVHHGNGTQVIFDDDPEVLYISSHSYPYYPGTGGVYEIGTGTGRGSIVNLPLRAHTGDEGIKRIYSQIVIPMLQRFHPQLILVSAGYDGHWADPLGNLDITTTGLAWISRLLVESADELCDGKIVFSLSGGYNLTALATGVANSIRALLGEKNFQDKLGPSSRPETELPPDYIQTIKEIHGFV